MAKKVDLKKRLDALRDEPAAPVDLQLHLDASLVQSLRSLAAHQRQSLEIYITYLLQKHVLDTIE